jgi:hypothetical protein
MNNGFSYFFLDYRRIRTPELDPDPYLILTNPDPGGQRNIRIRIRKTKCIIHTRLLNTLNILLGVS